MLKAARSQRSYFPFSALSFFEGAVSFLKRIGRAPLQWQSLAIPCGSAASRESLTQSVPSWFTTENPTSLPVSRRQAFGWPELTWMCLPHLVKTPDGLCKIARRIACVFGRASCLARRSPRRGRSWRGLADNWLNNIRTPIKGAHSSQNRSELMLEMFALRYG